LWHHHLKKGRQLTSAYNQSNKPKTEEKGGERGCCGNNLCLSVSQPYSSNCGLRLISCKTPASNVRFWMSDISRTSKEPFHSTCYIIFHQTKMQLQNSRVAKQHKTYTGSPTSITSNLKKSTISKQQNLNKTLLIKLMFVIVMPDITRELEQASLTFIKIPYS